MVPGHAVLAPLLRNDARVTGLQADQGPDLRRGKVFGLTPPSSRCAGRLALLGILDGTLGLTEREA